MKKTSALTSILLLGLAASCGSLPSIPGIGGGSNGQNGGGANVAEMLVDNYKKGTTKATPIVMLHDGAKVGQFAEWETYTWCVAGSKDGKTIVEQRFPQGYALAYLVDASVAAGKPNVVKAWVGKVGDEPSEIEVMQLQQGQAGAAGGQQPKVTEEPFSDVEIGGRTWSGKVLISDAGGMKSKVWMADGGWFGGMVRTEAAGRTTEAKKFGTDGEAALVWK